MNRVELEGVLAHELSHVRNYDILVTTIAVTAVGAIALMADLGLRFMWFGGRSDRRDNNDSGPLGRDPRDPLARAADPGAVRRPADAVRDEPPARAARRRRPASSSRAYPPGLISALEEAPGRPGGRPPRHPRHRADVDREPARARRGEGRGDLGPKKGTWLNRAFDTHPPLVGADRSPGGDVNRTRRPRRCRRDRDRRGAGRVRRQQRLEGRRQEEAGRVHDHDHDGAAGRAAHRAARPGRRRAGAARWCRSRSTTTSSAGPTADRHRRRRHRVGRGRRGGGHALPRDVPVAGPRRRRSGAVGAAHRPAHRLAGRRGVRLLRRREVRGRRHQPGTGRAHRRERAPATRCSATPPGGRRTTSTPSRRCCSPRAARRCRRRRCSTTPTKPVAAGTPASAVHIAFANQEFAPTYTWDAASGTWKRSTRAGPFVVKSGAQIAPKNVVVLPVVYGGTGVGNIGAEAQLVGSGTVQVFTNGRVDHRHLDPARQGDADEARRRRRQADRADPGPDLGRAPRRELRRSPSRPDSLRPLGRLRSSAWPGRSAAARLRRSGSVVRRSLPVARNRIAERWSPPVACGAWLSLPVPRSARHG